MPDLLGVAAQSCHYLRNFPSENALADAVLLYALWVLARVLFGWMRLLASRSKSFAPPEKDSELPANWRRWTRMMSSFDVIRIIVWIYLLFNLSLQLRHGSKSAVWLTLAASFLMILVIVWSWGFCLFGAQQQAKGPFWWQKLALRDQEERRAKDPFWRRRLILNGLPSLMLLLHILVRALQAPL